MPTSATGDDGMMVRFWGVRGSLPTPGPSTVRYGGNTPCVELRCGPHLLILDAGSGIRAFGASLGRGVEADILLSHTHYDHICGLPFFRPLFDPAATLRIWGGHLTHPDGIRSALSVTWRKPLMPDLDAEFRARVSFQDFAAGATLALAHGPRVDTIALRHPGGSVGYRISWAGRSVCYITDTEHSADGPDADLVAFVHGTDILIHDATYTEEEYRTRHGWGHATWSAAAELATAGRVGSLVLFHHDPDHDNDWMDAIGAAAARSCPDAVVAREGMRIALASLTEYQGVTASFGSKPHI